MSFTKITSDDTAGKGNVGQPDTPDLTTTEMQEQMDSLPNLIIEKFNELNLIRLGDIGWVFTDVDLHIESEEHEKALNLRLNNLSGDWDYDKLTSIFKDIQLSGLDVELTGFDDTEIANAETAEGGQLVQLVIIVLHTAPQVGIIGVLVIV